MENRIINFSREYTFLEKLVELNQKGYMLSLLQKEREECVYYDVVDKKMYQIPGKLFGKQKFIFYSKWFREDSEEYNFVVLLDVVAGIIKNGNILLIHEAPKINSLEELNQIFQYLVSEKGSNYDEQNNQKGQPF